MASDSRPINLYRGVSREAGPALFDRLDRIQSAIEALEVRRARSELVQQRFRQCLRALCLDVYCAYLSDPDLLVGVRRDSSALTNNPDYPAFVTARTFIDALDGLIQIGCIDQVELGNEASGHSTRIRGTQKLFDALTEESSEAPDIIDESPLIILSIGPRGRKTRKQFEDTPQTIIWRANLERINQNNSSYEITLNISADDQIELERLRKQRAEQEAALSWSNRSHRKIDYQRTRLHRVFNSVDWSEGGRFYGAWWQSVPKEYRQHILINGKHTCEYDYSGVHPRLLYHHAKCAMPNAGDPYSMPYGIHNRAVVKRAFNIMLNAPKRPRQETVPEFSSETLKMNWNTFLDGIALHHSGVQEYFYTGFGKRLQRLDSDMAEAVLLKLTGMNYPCLPIHDSFITFATLSDELPEYMEEVAQAHGLSGALAKEVFTAEYEGPTGLVDIDVNEMLDSLS